jgi:hypothetical protein
MPVRAGVTAEPFSVTRLGAPMPDTGSMRHARSLGDR